MIRYSYIDGEFVSECEIKKSKFITYVIGEVTKEVADNKINDIKKVHSKATHCTYAYVVDEGRTCKICDDGEPQGTAGKPILNAILNKGIVNTLVCVVRYFGGIKLGANGLVGAYNNSAVNGLENAYTSNKYLCVEVEINTSYQFIEQIKSIVNLNGKCGGVVYMDLVKLIAFIKKDQYENVIKKIMEFTSSKFELKEKEVKYIKL